MQAICRYEAKVFFTGCFISQPHGQTRAIPAESSSPPIGIPVVHLKVYAVSFSPQLYGDDTIGAYAIMRAT
jgi:hypothetical protein